MSVETDLLLRIQTKLETMDDKLDKHSRLMARIARKLSAGNISDADAVRLTKELTESADALEQAIKQ